MTHGVLAPQRSTFASRRTVNGSRAVTTPWVRPADWLALTTPDPTDQRMVGLHTVLQGGSNFVTVRSAVAFKVDWGDGAGWTNYAANTTAEKNLAWSDYSPGTLTSLGYRQAIVTVEAQSGNLTSLDLQQRHSLVPRAYSTGWLDVAVSLPYGTLTFGGGNVYQANVERVTVVTVAGTNFGNMFQYCYSLQSVPLLNTTNGTNFASMFQNCYSLQSAALNGTRYSIDYSNAMLSPAELDAIYTALGTAAGAQTITVTGNWGTAGDDPSIATAKGWTVAGS